MHAFLVYGFAQRLASWKKNLSDIYTNQLLNFGEKETFYRIIPLGKLYICYIDMCYGLWIIGSFLELVSIGYKAQSFWKV